MSLLDQSFGPGSLLTHQQESFTRTRETTTGTDTATGKPITSSSTGNVRGWFTWMTSNERNDRKDDGAAYILTRKGQLQAGDVISGALGEFLVLEDSPQRNGSFDRCNLRKREP